MKRGTALRVGGILLVCLLIVAGCSREVVSTNTPDRTGSIAQASPSRAAPPAGGRPAGPRPAEERREPAEKYSIEQAVSDNAQLSTIAFNGLAFITGSAGADTFMPPGKVADFFGFQYMRDIDQNEHGHNTEFLTTVANNVLHILNDSQIAQLVALAKEQESVYVGFAYNRFPLMSAFRANMEGKIPSGSSGLSRDAVAAYVANLYELDAKLSARRADVVGRIISSLTPDQKAYLAKMDFRNSATWPDIKEEPIDRRGLSHMADVAVMTYASEMFSWYKGSVESDTYFCPERHGTYFGGFYMKDYPAMGNPDYFISTSITGDSGQAFLQILTPVQRVRITSIIDLQRDALKEIVEIRREVSVELRRAMQAEAIDQEKVFGLVRRYGELDGEVSYHYASRFAEVARTLSTEQRAAVQKLRGLDVYPQGAYCYSSPVKTPAMPSLAPLFGIGAAPTDFGRSAAPSGFGDDLDPRGLQGQGKRPATK